MSAWRTDPDHRVRTVSPDVPILMYHSIHEAPNRSIQGLSVHPKTFAEQLKYLRSEGFIGLTFGELCKRRRDGMPLPERPVVLTFDDGYADFVDKAVPLMVEQGFPATVFVTTGWLDDAGPHAAGSAPDRMMSWAQLAELPAAGVEIGAHSHGHPELDQIGVSRLRAELFDPKHLLEDRLGHPVPSLAYPYGYSSKRVREISREAGYEQAAAVANANATATSDSFQVPRLTVKRSTSPTAFARIAHQRQTRLQYAPAHALTVGWAVVRRTRLAVRMLRPCRC